MLTQTHTHDTSTAQPLARQVGKNDRLLSVKEVAWHLNRHPNYVYLMRKAGFPMPGNRTTLQAALAWLEENPNWRRTLE